MKIILISSIIMISIVQLKAQITTTEVKIEQTNNVTSISGSLGIGTSTPSKPFHVKSDSNDDVLGYFEQSYGSSNDAGIAIKGSRNNSTTTASFINFDIYDNNEVNPTFTMAKIGAGKESNAGENGQLRFYTYNGNLNEVMRIKSNGFIGIGLTNPNFNLEVNGSIKGTTLHTSTQSWSDFVFEKNYKLLTLEEVEQHINKNGHLPEIPSEADVTENGINLGEMDAKLLQKIEELTLYVIEQNKQIQELRKEVLALKNE